MTDIRLKRQKGIIRNSIWGWIGIKEWKNEEYCEPECRWAFWKKAVLLRFTVDVFVFNLWKPWVVIKMGYLEFRNKRG